MSSPGSPSEEARESAGGTPAWHPAQEWLEEDDEVDMDYHPALEGSEDEDGWEEMDEDEMGLGLSDGEDHSRLIDSAVDEAV
jgi:WD repeat-containing protein 23